jgi:tRNA dimethylallyltransferase
MDKIIVILGPTAVGKTKLSVELAKKYNGEIINADSMQIYKDLNIGTAKITEEEKENIPHHLFDIKDVTADYSIYDYQIDSRKIIIDILKRGKTPILVGGTGLYIKSCLYDYKLEKETTTNNYQDKSTEELYQELVKLDKNINIDKHNRRRVVRALDYYKANNKSISDNKTDTLLYNAVFIGLTTSRDILYEKINKRVDAMINNGLVEEVEYFWKHDIHTKPLEGGIGYKELYKYFAKEVSLETAIDLIKKNSRHYAKRQYTFFNNQLPVTWFTTDYDNFDKTVNEVSKYIDNLK